jgi:hypothetical protein
MRYYFVVTYGRSGSTLLQGVLNNIPGWEIRGENGNALWPLYQFYSQTIDRVEHHGKYAKTDRHPWYGIGEINREELREGIKALFENNFLRPGVSTRATGFKEVRYGAQIGFRITEFLRFIEDLFPKANFIFNERDIDATVKSGWWAKNANSRSILSRYLAAMKDAYRADADNHFWIKYEDYKDDVNGLRSLFEWINEPFDKKSIERKLAEKHSY